MRKPKKQTTFKEDTAYHTAYRRICGSRNMLYNRSIAGIKRKKRG